MLSLRVVIYLQVNYEKGTSGMFSNVWKKSLNIDGHQLHQYQQNQPKNHLSSLLALPNTTKPRHMT